jgi:hypothetical protein
MSRERRAVPLAGEWTGGWWDREQDMTKLTDVFRNFSKAPNNGITFINQLVEQQMLEL